MWESLLEWWNAALEWDGWGTAGIAGAWLVAICLMVVGMLGCIVPVIPGHLLILMAVVAFRLMLGPASGVAWWTFLVLALLLTASQVFEFVSGAAGSRWFGGTRWGAAGALVGGIVGIFFMPFGLILGPLLGAYGFEALFAKQEHGPAMVSGVGSAVGTLASIVVKVLVGLVMILVFAIDVFLIR